MKVDFTAGLGTTLYYLASSTSHTSIGARCAALRRPSFAGRAEHDLLTSGLPYTNVGFQLAAATICSYYMSTATSVHAYMRRAARGCAEAAEHAPRRRIAAHGDQIAFPDLRIYPQATVTVGGRGREGPTTASILALRASEHRRRDRERGGQSWDAPSRCGARARSSASMLGYVRHHGTYSRSIESRRLTCASTP